MHTPSLRRRVVVLGVGVVTVVVATVNALLYLGFRAEVEQQLEAVVAERARMVQAQATTLRGNELARRLAELGVRARIRMPDGVVHRADPPLPPIGNGVGGQSAAPAPVITRDVRLGDGSTATIVVRRTSVDAAAHTLLVLVVAGVVVAVLLSTLLLLRASKWAIRPLRQIAASARRTMAGHRGERLRPDRPDTALGQFATAYDEMLDALESTVASSDEAQRESERLYLHLRQTIETANAAFVAMTPDGVIADWSTRAEQLFGWSRREAVGRELAETIIPPELREQHRGGLRRFLEKGESRILGKLVEMEAMHRDGRRLRVELSTWVTYGSGERPTFNAFVQDVTERVRGQEAVARLAAIVDSAQEAMFSTTLNGKILTWNGGAESLYQFSAEEAIGRHVAIITPPDRADELERDYERLARGEKVPRYETVRQRKDGAEVEVAVTVSPVFDSRGAVTAASAVARDISDQRRMASQLSTMLSELQSALGEAQRAEERSRRFLADAAHQLRTPIAGIRACAETLLMGTRRDDTERLMASLVQETSHAAGLVTSLLRLAQVDQGYMAVRERCDVLTICRTEVDRVKALALELRIELHANVQSPVEVDRHAITEILANLLDNACRHATTRIDVSVNAAGDLIELIVADDGPGVPQDAVERIFERFVTLDGRGGSGLGLPIARALARAQGGDLVYERGAFRVVLPLEPRPSGETAGSEEAGYQRLPSSPVGLTVEIAEAADGGRRD